MGREESAREGWSALLKPAWLPAVAVLVGGVLMHSMNVLMLATALPSVVALLSAAWSLSIVVGPLVGGVFARYGNWRGAFFLVASIACVLALVALRALPRTLTGAAAPRVPGLRVALICAAIAAMSLTAI